MKRRRWLKLAAACSVAPLFGLSARRVLAEEQVVKLVAQRFHYTPNAFEVKAGQPLLLEITSLDFVHGFSIPDLKMRADLVPGVVTRMRLNIDKPGVYDFLCDNFCGSGHEEMNGRIIAKA